MIKNTVVLLLVTVGSASLPQCNLSTKYMYEPNNPVPNQCAFSRCDYTCQLTKRDEGGKFYMTEPSISPLAMTVIENGPRARITFRDASRPRWEVPESLFPTGDL